MQTAATTGGHNTFDTHRASRVSQPAEICICVSGPTLNALSALIVMLTIYLLSLWADPVSYITAYRPYLSLEQYPITHIITVPTAWQPIEIRRQAID
jgi:hypothetical protein